MALGVNAQVEAVGYTVVITTDYRAPTAEAHESSVTTPLERALQGVSGVLQIRSATVPDRSTLRVVFKSTDVPSCDSFTEITNAVLAARRTFPVDAPAPVVNFGGGQCKKNG
jgi:multidrug efflux pump subunit AcrB